MSLKHILISRTDSIGDVILTLPLTGLLKKRYPDVKISFLGMPYTSEVIRSCKFVDSFVDWNSLNNLSEAEAVQELKNLSIDLVIQVFPRKEISSLTKKAEIRERLGTTGRWYHWRDCNMLIPLTRRRSDLHESLLNLKLAERVHKFKIEKYPPKDHNDHNTITMTDIPNLYGLSVISPIDPTFGNLINSSYKNIILHPRSKGSSREWGIENYAKLAQLLSAKVDGASTPEYKVFITGTKIEGEMLRKEGFFDLAGDVVDVTGKFNLTELMQFISTADVLIAGSTGPLHIASALGKIAIGLYPPIKPMDPGRWAPIGENASFVVASKECNQCKKMHSCECMQLISIDMVYQKLMDMIEFSSKKNIQS